MKHLNTLLLFLYAVSVDVAAADSDWKLRPSSKILLQRELGKSKTGKLFFGRESKSSKSKSSKASRSKQSSKSAKSTYGQFAKSAKAKSAKANYGDIDRTPPPTPAEETVTKFLETEDKGDYRGLRTQNIILVTIGALAILATIAAVRIKSKRAANAEPVPDENRILDSVEVSAVVGAARPKRPPPPRTARAPVGGTDNSCDFFGFHNCLA